MPATTIPRLAHRPVWLALGWALVALVVYLSLTPRPPHIGEQLGDKAHHLIAYFTLMFWFAQLHPRHLAVALRVLALGLAIEIAQGFTGYRQASALDMLANTLGVALGWLSARRLPNLPGWLERHLP